MHLHRIIPGPPKSNLRFNSIKEGRMLSKVEAFVPFLHHFFINAFRSDRICSIYARGTRNAGSRLIGNCVTMVLAGSFIKYRNGVGMERSAIATMLRSRANPILFQRIMANLGSVLSSIKLERRVVNKTAVTPVTMSKFLPSNVI